MFQNIPLGKSGPAGPDLGPVRGPKRSRLAYRNALGLLVSPTAPKTWAYRPRVGQNLQILAKKKA